jgi:hypothetical protein
MDEAERTERLARAANYLEPPAPRGGRGASGMTPWQEYRYDQENTDTFEKLKKDVDIRFGEGTWDDGMHAYAHGRAIVAQPDGTEDPNGSVVLLHGRWNNATRKYIGGRRIPREEWRHYMDRADRLRAGGAPATGEAGRPISPEEARNLPPGTEFLGQDGNTYRVPARPRPQTPSPQVIRPPMAPPLPGAPIPSGPGRPGGY